MHEEREVRGPGNMPDKVLRRRYLLQDPTGRCTETEEQMYRRVAKKMAQAETRYGATPEQVRSWERHFYELMNSGRFLPSSPVLMNAGTRIEQYSACFVLPVKDSLEAIFTTIKQAALVNKTGGGTGFSFTQLRPKGDIVGSTGGVASGPVSFMRTFDAAMNEIKQGGKRRGAGMAILHITHPDIVRFICTKRRPGVLENFNISVAITDEFMEQLQDASVSPHVVANPRTKKRYCIPHSIDEGAYTIDDLVPENSAKADCYAVREIWHMIVKSAWACGEPGVVFIDEVNRHNPTPDLGDIEATNPCGEQPLLAYEACVLGSIVVVRFINAKRTDLDWAKLAEAVRLAVRFLDNIVDSHYPIPQIERITLGNRKVGLGVMGFADALVSLGIRYDSQEAVAFAEKLASFIQEEAHKASEELAKERGSFPSWKGSTWDTKHNRPMRNAAVTTIAPTGSISILARCSAGIEPIFQIVTRRRALQNQEFTELHPLIHRLGTKEGWLTNDVCDLLAKGVPPQEIPQIPARVADVLLTAHEVAPEWHVRIQAAFQKYIDNAVSKTVNLPATATAEDVDSVYRLAYQERCKGITVYVDGCRENQVITAAHQTAPDCERIASPRPRPKKTTGATIKTKTGCGSLYVTINQDEQGLFEIFTNLGKAGGCPSQSEATARVLSVALRSGVPTEVLVEQLKGIRCLSTIARRKGNKKIDVLSCPDAIARALEAAMGHEYEPVIVHSSNACPDCKYPLRREAGCNVCDNCGYSKCG